LLICAVLVGAVSTRSAAQDAVTISGHVSSGNVPLEGASVRILNLDVGSVTDRDGRYSFIVPSSRVRGQRATITARHVRFTTQTAEVTLTGGSLVRDFNLPPVGAGRQPGVSPNPGEAPVMSSATAARAPSFVAVVPSLVDSTAFADAPGPIDLPSALEARVAGVVVTSASALGGSSPIVIRGQRSFVTTSQPLYVVDGSPIDNSTITTLSQRFGFGGFDYGSAAQDVNLGDIATVQVLSGPAAGILYGGRAANGVVLITTKSGRGLNGIDVSASQQVTIESAILRPSYQNSFGQGLHGQFAFFNGQGGGQNDGVAENWGPALNGQPIAQASLNEAKRGEVAAWVAHPDNVSGFFSSGRTFTTNAAAQGSNDRGSFRLSVNNRDFTGVTPKSSITRRGVGLTAGVQPTSAFSASGNIQYSSDNGANRPGSGFDQSNVVSTFTQLGRQVDVAALKRHLVDAKGDPISWNYNGQNNPYFDSELNVNKDDQSRVFGGLGASYAISPSFSIVGRIGADSYDANRGFSVARLWMGGYPYFTGRGDFPEGGVDNEAISVSEKNAQASLQFTPGGGASPLALSVGASWRGTSLTLIDTVVADTATGIAGAPRVITPSRFASDDNMHAIFGSAQYRFEDYGNVTVGVRNEWSSVYAPGHDSQLYPSVVGVLDLKRAMSSLRDDASIGAARLRAGVSRSGNDLSAYTLRGIYTGTQAANNTTLGSPLAVGTSTTLEAETTTSFELGGNIQFFANRLDLDLAFYNDNTSNLIVPAISQNVATPTNAGSVTNTGIEATIAATLVSNPAFRWDITGNFAHNSSSVGSLASGSQSVALTPTRWGASLQARTGEAFAAIVGNGYLRNSSGQLLLSKGLPLPDTIAGAKVLGTTAPSWTGGLGNTVHFGWFDISALLSARMGGKIFSATNLWGMTSGSFSETVFRPDSGLLIDGVDAATGGANKVHVSTEDYYHALRAIPERWVYDASMLKLQEARISATFPLRSLPGFRAQSIRASLIARNLFTWAKAPNIDPETAVSSWGLQGFELGQLPTTRSLGFQVTITP
jgi:TonB-dependent SusC/RagA subfamily outer membrane receptor